MGKSSSSSNPSSSIGYKTNRRMETKDEEEKGAGTPPKRTPPTEE